MKNRRLPDRRMIVNEYTFNYGKQRLSSGSGALGPPVQMAPGSHSGDTEIGLPPSADQIAGIAHRAAQNRRAASGAPADKPHAERGIHQALFTPN